MTIRTIVRIRGRSVSLRGEDVLLTDSLEDPDRKWVLSLNRNHWLIEIMHRDRDVFPGEDGYTNRMDHAPRNVFSMIGAARTMLKRISTSVTEVIKLVRRDPGVALRLF